MKKSAFPAALIVIAAGLSGCPIYDHDTSGCFSDSDCDAGYQCDADSGSCYAEQDQDDKACRRPLDCGTNETCSRSATCMIGDCHFDSVGCVQGFACVIVEGVWACVDEDELGQAGAGAGGAGASGGAPPAGGEPAGGGSSVPSSAGDGGSG